MCLCLQLPSTIFSAVLAGTLITYSHLQCHVLMTAGPGSTHLDLVNIILKNDTFTLWKYMQTLSGDDLVLLVTSLKRDFVYSENISADHYATLMETHIDKVFKTILTGRQVEEARRGLLDLHMFYLSRMNHVPHIGPRLSHLCFLIFSRYDDENPFMGQDDWVLLRHHLKGVKDVIVDPSFRVASEAQYRAPKTLEKILLAAVHDGMLELMFKDFMILLQTICNHSNSRCCKRLFLVYRESLFDKIDFKKGFEATPYWLFDQCMQTLHVICKTISMETHIDEIIIHVQKICLMNFTQLKPQQIKEWHSLMMNYIVSGRVLLVREATVLLFSQVLKENQAFVWKEHIDQGRMLVDIIADLPSEFLERSEDGTTWHTAQAYAEFITSFLEQIRSQGLEGRLKENVQMCLLKCLEKNVPHKAVIAQACLMSKIPNIKDNFIKDVLFCVDNVLKDPKCPIGHSTLTNVLEILLSECLDHFRSKGYFTVDANSLLASITLSCVSADLTKDGEEDLRPASELAMPNGDMFNTLYKKIVVAFVAMHREKHTLHSISNIVQEVIYAIQNSIQRSGSGHLRCVHFLSDLGVMCISMITSHVTSLLELFLKWGCYSIDDLLMLLAHHDVGAFLNEFQDLFDGVENLDRDVKHRGMRILKYLSQLHPKIFDMVHIRQLFDRYDEESEQTQEISLEILINIASCQPKSLVPFFHILTDDSKFQAGSLPGRIRIFEKLQGLTDEYPQPLTDYVMRFLDCKNPEVTNAAKEFLGPLFHEHPKFLVKHRVRLKSLWKSTSNHGVKEFCVKVLPEIQTMQRLDQSKNKTTVETVKTSGPRKESVIPAIKRVGQESAQSSRSKSDMRTDKTNVNKVAINGQVAKEIHRPVDDKKDFGAQILKDSGYMPRMDANQIHPTEVQILVSSEKRKTFMNLNDDGAIVSDQINVDDTVVEKEKTNINTVSINENITKKKYPSELDNKNDMEAHISKDFVDMQGKDVSQIQSTEVEIKDAWEKRTTLINLKDDDTIGRNHIKVHDAMVELNESESVSKAIQKAIVFENINFAKDIAAQNHTVNVMGTTKSGALPVSPDFKHVSPNAISKYTYIQPLAISGGDTPMPITKADENRIRPASDLILISDKCSFNNMQELSTTLADVGYVNSVLDFDQEIPQTTKMIIYCMPDNDRDFTDSMKITELLQGNTPKICVLLHKVALSNGSTLLKGLQAVLDDKDYIRMYAKSHEAVIEATKYPRYKFTALLMRLNYNGLITRNTSSVTSIKTVNEGSLTRGTDSHTCDVYLSYHWCKQAQAESLYRTVSSLGFRCWLASQRMESSVSLYNKISQGIQESRVVVACITSNYHNGVECRRDIAIAKSLGRPIVPLILEKTAWPVKGDIGKTLSMYQSISLELSSTGAAIQELRKVLSRYAKHRIEDGSDPIQTRDNDNVNYEIIDANENGELPLYKKPNNLHKSVSMFDVGGDIGTEDFAQNDSSVDKCLPRSRSSLPIGVVVDEDGITTKTARSKSCNIL
ncbi:uncharacterized protein LOC127869320 isoform X2 [Dreissena polymorpha]|uniref:uncharacterized protein LOC127869320 isoform X2 n=1 Tax=Dreissena polymorpha TaxID=45954 RepID=UPI0022653150|nr:uncharacterized protein LOC127869320 isoform X2 [Dreissena polymorpha]